MRIGDNTHGSIDVEIHQSHHAPAPSRGDSDFPVVDGCPLWIVRGGERQAVAHLLVRINEAVIVFCIVAGLWFIFRDS